MSRTVSILSEGYITLPTGVGTSRRMLSVTYSVDGAMPRIVYLDPDKDTPDERKRVIAEDWQKAQGESPPTIELP
jgi:hypothetical protein